MLILLSLLTSAVAIMAVPLIAESRALYHPNSSEVYFTSFKYAGTGCPKGSVDYYASPNLETLTLFYNGSFVANTPAASGQSCSKYCRVLFGLQLPNGVQFSFFKTDVRGYAALGANVTGVLSNYYYFSGESQTAYATAYINGPVQANYEVTTDLVIASAVWSPCGANVGFNMNSAVSVYAAPESTGPGTVGELSEQSVDAKISFIVGIKFRKCVP